MKRTILLAVLILALTMSRVLAADVVVVTNKNLADCRTAAGKAIQMAGTLPGLPGTIPLVEFDGSAADDHAIQRLKDLRPKVVISLAPYTTHIVKQILPDAWIVYALVPYPEVEGFTRDPKMVGIPALGSESDLFKLSSALGQVKRLAVLHSDVISPSVQPLLARLNDAGFAATDFPLSQAPLLSEALSRVTKNQDAVLLLPDPLTANPYALRFIVTTCIEKKILTLTTDYGLVGSGVLCGTFISPETAGMQAAIVAGKILTAGKPPAHPMVFFQGSRTTVSTAALAALNMPVPKIPDIALQ